MSSTMAEVEIAMDHHNARKQREKWCECCGRSVPVKDHSWKFAAAGGVLAGPFCSETCYWRFVRDSWDETSAEDRRRYYLYGHGEDDDPDEYISKTE